MICLGSPSQIGKFSPDHRLGWIPYRILLHTLSKLGHLVGRKTKPWSIDRAGRTIWRRATEQGQCVHSGDSGDGGVDIASKYVGGSRLFARLDFAGFAWFR